MHCVKPYQSKEHRTTYTAYNSCEEHSENFFLNLSSPCCACAVPCWFVGQRLWCAGCSVDRVSTYFIGNRPNLAQNWHFWSFWAIWCQCQWHHVMVPRWFSIMWLHKLLLPPQKSEDFRPKNGQVWEIMEWQIIITIMANVVNFKQL